MSLEHRTLNIQRRIQKDSLDVQRSMFNVRCFQKKISTLVILLAAANLTAEETNSLSTPKFLGAQSCSASSCHGGAGNKSNQYTIWSTRDFHHARPYATL